MLEVEIEAFTDALRMEAGLSENTRLAYLSDLRFFLQHLKARGKREADQIALEDIGGFLRNERDEGLKPATRARRAAAIRGFMKFLKERRVIKHNPAELMDATKTSRPLPKVLTEAEVAGMLDKIDGKEPRELRDRAILEALYGCGLRVSELCDLKMENIVADGELLRIFGKGGKDRLVPIGSAAGRSLRIYMEDARTVFTKGDFSVPYIFVTRLGSKFTRRGVFKIVKERAAAAGIEEARISPHVLRHCFASHMLSRGADIRAIQELLGHADIGTTQVYTHVDAAKFSEVHKLHPRH